MINTLFIFSAKYLYLVVGIIAIIYFWKQPRATQKQIFIFTAVALPLIYIVAKIASLFYYSTRPFVLGGFQPLIPHEADNGFPSDHTLVSAAISSVLYPFSKKVSIAGWILTLLVGLSRICVGVHQPIDIFGSIIIAIIISVVAYQLVQRLKYYLI